MPTEWIPAREHLLDAGALRFGNTPMPVLLFHSLLGIDLGGPRCDFG